MRQGGGGKRGSTQRDCMGVITQRETMGVITRLEGRARGEYTDRRDRGVHRGGRGDYRVRAHGGEYTDRRDRGVHRGGRGDYRVRAHGG